MRDRYWQAVHTALQPLLGERDLVLLPRGGWAPFRCACRFYDELIEIGDATVLVLHKGRMTGLPKAELRHIAEQWQWVYGNEVFVVLSRPEKQVEDIRHRPDNVHFRPLMDFLRSAALRRRRSRIVYAHLPKTGGSSLFMLLAQTFPSHVYYTSPRALLAHPPAPEDFDLIGVHFPVSGLAEILKEDDWVIGMVRDPTQRLLSAALHARRENADPATFAPTMKAMRESELTAFLGTDLGRYETRLQLIFLGGDHRQPLDGRSDRDMLAAARAFAERERVVLAPTERSAAFVDMLSELLEFRPGVLHRINANDAAARAAHQPEFDRAAGLVNAMNAPERELYEFVCRSFEARRAARPARRRRP